MKLAILGNSPLALEAALRFHLHGAALTLYLDSDSLEGFTSMDLPAVAYTSELGLGILKEMNLTYAPECFSWKEWEKGYKSPLLQYIKAHQELISDEVVSVTKRFLALEETIPGKSRFFDLFRIIHKVNPRDFIESQKETDPEVYKRLNDEVLTSLSSTIEMYQDYDLVLDLRSDLGKASAAVSGRALGENRQSEKLSYGLEALKVARGIKPNPDNRELALIGSDSLSAEILLALEEWVRDTHSRLFIVSNEEDPFSKFFGEGSHQTVDRLKNLFKDIENEFNQEIEVFTKKLKEWQQLDDFVQVKIPKPSEPIPRLNYFSGHNVTAMDELVDRKRMFLTLERPEFRQGKKHPENNILDLKTIGVDHILVGHAKKNRKLVELNSVELGYFDLVPSRPNVNRGWENDLKKLEGIEDEIFKLFSPVGAH